jgi:DNA-binding transcriptional LysR family regulator
MATKRYRLPPLNFISGFEAAARNLSFTRAADELFITQSAVSKQIKALEEHLGARLFERRTRELVLTPDGQALYRVAAELLEWLQQALDKIRTGGANQQLAITASTGFTSLWLIPRLKRFRKLYPNIDVRISATVEILNLERSLIDVAIRYIRPDAAPEGAIRLFDHVAFPVCSPRLLADPQVPLVEPADLRNHVLLHLTPTGDQRGYVDWESWLAAIGIHDLEPAGSLHFNQYEQMIQAAIDGQGVAVGLSPLLNDFLQSGALVAPFDTSVAESRIVYIVKSLAAEGKPQVGAFVRWLLDEAKSDAQGTKWAVKSSADGSPLGNP